MSELCHICDLFRTALFGPTNTNEDHLDDGQGNDLPRPMADAPATMGVRSRARPGGGTVAAKAPDDPDAAVQPQSQGQAQAVAGSGATATPSVASETAAPPVAAQDARAAAAVAMAAGAGAAGGGGAGAGAGGAGAASGGAEPVVAAAGKPAPKMKFSKRASRGMKTAPAYMSFDDVNVEACEPVGQPKERTLRAWGVRSFMPACEDSDGQLFIDEGGDSIPHDVFCLSLHGSRSPTTAGFTAGAGEAAAEKAAAAYSVNAPSVYRQPSLPAAAPAAPVVAAPAAPAEVAPPAPAYNSRIAADAHAGAGTAAGDAGGNAAGGDGMLGPGIPADGAEAVGGGGDPTAEAFPTGGEGTRKGLGLQWGAGNGMAGERESIPRDGSTLDSARPHGQSESFHGYKGYPGYEPDTPNADTLTQQARAESTEALTINPGADVSDPRNVGKKQAAWPTPSTLSKDPRQENDLGSARLGQHAENTYVEDRHYAAQQQQPQQAQHPSISPSGTSDMATTVPAGASRIGANGRVEVTSNRQPQQKQQLGSNNSHLNPGVRLSSGLGYDSHTGSAYRGAGSPSQSVDNSMTSSYRNNIPQIPSEDGMGSVLGTLAGTEDPANEDLQWKRSALKKFHKVMVKGEGLRVVKHNRSGGSQMRIIRYDPDIKALVWNSKRYMKKAGSANVPIVGIKRVGREGNTVSVTAAGRGTIGFEPQRIRDAKILAEALRALVDKEERSAMWRG
eukprot:jgi/Undpi1/12551/HiC_scaffold_6.g02220.m1